MCGIFGILNLESPRPFDEARFADALQTIRHRGPDAQLFKRLDDTVILGHNRLSIIDLSDCSNQPLSFAGRYWLIYNGEIFNYIELRDELQALGAIFTTTGDVEVLVQAYAQWGPDCVTRFNGMWAFAIYDTAERTLFCSRDRFGIKPFNYAVHQNRLLFGSEIKPILHYAPELREPDYNAIANYCRTSVGAQHAQTWFSQVQRLQPGCNMVVADGRVSIQRYWDYPDLNQRELSFAAARDGYRALFEDAVRLRMRSDVPLGITLSSGVDSSSIACVMQQVDPSAHHAYTAHFADDESLVQDSAIYKDGSRRIDEAQVARKLAKRLGLQSHVVETRYDDFVGELAQIIRHLESGNSSPAVIPLMQLLRKARENLTVFMDGQGADELLGGYINAVLWPAELDLLRKGSFRSALRGLRAYKRTYTLGSAVRLGLRQLGNRVPGLTRLQQRVRGLDRLYGPRLRDYAPMADFPSLRPVRGESSLARRLREQHSGGLVNLLHYGDAISMANSLEARMPFLDHRLVEFVWPLPSDYKVRLGIGKFIHREAMRGTVNDDILDERNKYGFTTPIGHQFRKEFPSGTGPVDILLSERCLERGIFDRAGVTSLIEDHRSGAAHHGTILFRLLSVELWFREFIDDMPGSHPAPRTASEPAAMALA